ncbi:hypothetical protein HJG60_009618 [Phyllostomus discolor]|uniref:Uncharacterized protein n=1 Tax=Phyllostomus discolor TaxID=89673 RepID=A0A833Y8A7_9CHIR|nr:hypothetical protein HJG60_009618 [Phyllostomus discolor]
MGGRGWGEAEAGRPDEATAGGPPWGVRAAGVTLGQGRGDGHDTCSVCSEGQCTTVSGHMTRERGWVGVRRRPPTSDTVSPPAGNTREAGRLHPKNSPQSRGGGRLPYRVPHWGGQFRGPSDTGFQGAARAPGAAPTGGRVDGRQRRGLLTQQTRGAGGGVSRGDPEAGRGTLARL